jgi:hypothetical protein
MTDKEIVRELMKTTNVSSPVLAEKLKYKIASGVTEKLRRKEAMRLDTFVKFISALEGTLIVRHEDREFELNFDTKTSLDLDALLAD